MDLAIAESVHEQGHAPEDEEIAARCAATLLITATSEGEVETLARRIHAASCCAASPFVRAWAGGLPIEAGMLRDTCAGLLDAAVSGSLLLTNVEDLPAIVQDGLVEMLAELQRARAPSAPVRLIAGTSVALCDRIAAGTFSERLFYRLNIIHLVVKNGAIVPKRLREQGTPSQRTPMQLTLRLPHRDRLRMGRR